MKVKVIATGEIIDVEPSYVNDEGICYKHKSESGVSRIYRPYEVDMEPLIREIEPKMQEIIGKYLDEMNNPREYRYTVKSRYDWDAIRISAAKSALQACIISGKPNPVQSSMRYSQELVDALRAEFE